MNLEDKNSLAVIDAHTLAVQSVIPLSGCEEPSGLALNAGARQLFAVCDNHVMVMVDVAAGRVLGSAPICGSPDGAGYDAGARLAFASCGDGMLTVVAQASGGALQAVQSVPTRRGARTMALDERRHRIYLVTADYGATPAATPEHPHPRPAILPGTFRLLVIAPQRSETDEQPGRKRPMSLRTPAILAAALAAAGITCAALGAENAADKASDVLAHDVFKELIEINTTDSAAGNVTTGVEAMAKRFRDAGFPPADMVVLGPENPKKKNLVVRLHGTGKHKPVLLIGHIDVVEAHREDWNLDPFKLTEQDGYFYGRGTSDMKGDDAIMVATLLRMKKEGYKPDRDIILALTADEESGCCNGPDWLIKNHRNLIDAEFVINTDGYSVRSEKGVATMFRLGATEKMYGDYQLTVTNKGGHSSEPRADNAIYELSQALHQRLPVPVPAGASTT